MYETNPRFQSEKLGHPGLQNPQMTNPLQQTPTTSGPESAQGPQQGLTPQQTPPIGELAAQMADLQARQSSLEAQQVRQGTQRSTPTPLSPTAQRVSPTFQPTGPQSPSPSQEIPQTPRQQLPHQPQGGLQRQAGPAQQPPQMPTSPMQQPQPMQNPMQQPQPMQQPFSQPQGPQPGPQGAMQQTQGMQPGSQMPQASPMGLSTGGPQGPQPGQRITRQPPVDVLDEGENFVLEIDLPGIHKEDIRLTSRSNAIQLVAPTRERQDRENLLQSERGQIVYQRSIPLGVEIDSEEIQAKYEDGILRVKAPKRDPTSGPRRVEVD